MFGEWYRPTEPMFNRLLTYGNCDVNNSEWGRRVDFDAVLGSFAFISRSRDLRSLHYRPIHIKPLCVYNNSFEFLVSDWA